MLARVLTTSRSDQRSNRLLYRTYGKHDAAAATEPREKIEYLPPRLVLLIEQEHATSRFLVGYDFRARLDPITEQVAPHIARRNPHPRVSPDAFRFAGIRRAVDIEGFRSGVYRISREPNRSNHALTTFAKGFEAHIFIALKGIESRGSAHTCSMLSLRSVVQGIYRQVREPETDPPTLIRAVDNFPMLGQA